VDGKRPRNEKPDEREPTRRRKGKEKGGKCVWVKLLSVFVGPSLRRADRAVAGGNRVVNIKKSSEGQRKGTRGLFDRPRLRLA